MMGRWIDEPTEAGHPAARPDDAGHADRDRIRWLGVLANYATHLDQQQRYLTDVEAARRGDIDPDQLVAPPAFAPPQDLPPVPPEFVDQLDDLIDRTSQLRAAAERCLGMLRALGSRPSITSATPGSSILDQSL